MNDVSAAWSRTLSVTSKRSEVPGASGPILLAVLGRIGPAPRRTACAGAACAAVAAAGTVCRALAGVADTRTPAIPARQAAAAHPSFNDPTTHPRFLRHCH